MDSLSVKIVADGTQPPTNQAEFSALATGSLLVFASGPYQGAWAVTKVTTASVQLCSTLNPENKPNGTSDATSLFLVRFDALSTHEVKVLPAAFGRFDCKGWMAEDGKRYLLAGPTEPADAGSEEGRPGRYG